MIVPKDRNARCRTNPPLPNEPTAADIDAPLFADPPTADIDALLFAGPPAQADTIRRTLAARDGAILPLIQDRPDGSYDLTRLVVEKVASINTTAAGGNASLMSLAGE